MKSTQRTIPKATMDETIDFQSLGIEISDILKSYPSESQREIFEYLSSLDAINRKCYVIAFEHLGSSFNIARSNGFKEWQQAKKKGV